MHPFDEGGGSTGEFGIRSAEASDDDRSFQAITRNCEVG